MYLDIQFLLSTKGALSGASYFLDSPFGHGMNSGAGDRTRTYDPIITNDVLYQLSYTGTLAGLIAPCCLVEKH